MYPSPKYSGQQRQPANIKGKQELDMQTDDDRNAPRLVQYHTLHVGLAVGVETLVKFLRAPKREDDEGL